MLDLKRYTTVLTVAALLASPAPAPASDPLASLRYLAGTWNCTYNAGKTRIAYQAKFAYDLSSNWVRESDTSKVGSGLGMLTYDPKRPGWTMVVVQQDRTSVVFHGAGANPNQITYRSIYPDKSMTDVFERLSPVRYSLHFTQVSSGKTIKSTDICTKR